MDANMAQSVLESYNIKGNKDLLGGNSESNYKDFDAGKAKMTYDIMGKHITEFRRREEDEIPEIFILLTQYFETNEEYMKLEGIFRKCPA